MAGEAAAVPAGRQQRGHEEEALRELLALAVAAEEATRARAVGAVLGLTGNAEGRRLVAGEAAALLALSEDPCPAVARDALRALVNVAAAEEEPPGAAGGGGGVAGALNRGSLLGLLRRALDGGGEAAEAAAALLANASREESACRGFWDAVAEEVDGALLARLLDALGRRREPHLAALLCNLSRLPDVRRRLLDPCRCVIQRLLPHAQGAGPDLLRRSVIGTLRNCCFDYEYHRWLLSEEVDILPFLLLPLAGPEEFPEEEMESLPLDLQYLPPEKQREPDPQLRKMLLETIMLLTATKPGRQLVREKGTYAILRELHKWEMDPGARAACEKLIHVLIADEPEAGMENLLEVEIPAEVEERLRSLDQQQEEEEEEERSRAPASRVKECQR